MELVLHIHFYCIFEVQRLFTEINFKMCYTVWNESIHIFFLIKKNYFINRNFNKYPEFCFH